MTHLSALTPCHRGFPSLRFGNKPSPQPMDTLYDKLCDEANLVRAEHHTSKVETLARNRQAFLEETILTIPFPSEHLATPKMQPLTGQTLLSLMQRYSQDNKNCTLIERVERLCARPMAFFTRNKSGPPFFLSAFMRTLIPLSFNAEVSSKIQKAASKAEELGFLQPYEGNNMYSLSPAALKALEAKPL